MPTAINPHDAPSVYPAIAAQVDAFQRHNAPHYAADWLFNIAYRLRRSRLHEDPSTLDPILDALPAPHAANIRRLLADWPTTATVPNITEPNQPTPRPDHATHTALRLARTRAAELLEPTHGPA